MTEMGVTGGYVRHRDRMVQESVFDDMRNTLIACRWLEGTTSRQVFDLDTKTWTTVTTTAAQVYPLLQGHKITLIDYFPEAEEGGVSTAPNTLALSNGLPGDAIDVEMGSNLMAQPYVFNMAFYSISDAVASAVLNDLRDRYLGRILNQEYIDLYDFNQVDPAVPVVRMEVETFRYTMATDDIAAPAEVHLYFAELRILDFVD